MTCTDCKKPVTVKAPGWRRDICCRCWVLRARVVSMLNAGEMSPAAFREIQEGMARGEGQKAMLLATNPDLYEI